MSSPNVIILIRLKIYDRYVVNAWKGVSYGCVIIKSSIISVINMAYLFFERNPMIKMHMLFIYGTPIKYLSDVLLFGTIESFE